MRGGGRLAGRGDFWRENSAIHVRVDAELSGVEILNWFGLGNDAPRLDSLGRHAVDLAALKLDARLIGPMGPHASAEVGAFAIQSWTRDAGHAGFFDTVRDTLFGAGAFLRMGVVASAEVDTRDRQVAPSRGVLVRASARALPAMFDVDEAYARVDGEVRTYRSAAERAGRPTLALRAGGAKLFGGFGFQDAAFLGGRQNLRGWDSERFAGDGSVYGGAEVRVRTAGFAGALAGDAGVYAAMDVGRVFFQGASPGGWHAGVGGGVWVALFDHANTLTLGFARGAERTGMYAGLDFPF